MKTAIIILLLAFATAAHAEDAHTWTRTDYALEVTYQALHLVDWRQTVTISQNGDKYIELNKSLGPHPSHGNVNRYMGFIAVGHVVVSIVLPRPARTVWQSISLLEVAAAVNSNRRLGIGATFHF